jgi:hypothetical protein
VAGWRVSSGRVPSAGLLAVVLQAGVLGAVVLLLAYARAPVTLGLNAFWYLLLLAIVLLGGLAWGRPRAAVVAAEVVLALVAVQGLWSAATPGARPPAARLGDQYGVSWRLTFTGPQQALMKTLPLPNEWEGRAVYLRVDLGAGYEGPAGFAVEVNGQELGDLSARTADRSVSTSGIPSWSMRLPDRVVDSAPLARVVLRPSGIDPRLTVAGHADPLVEPLGVNNSFFFDGETWRNDRLAGPDYGPAGGTYRVWLEPIMGK